MYLAHFGLKELPFTLTPNTHFFVKQGPHLEALNVLLVSLRAGEGFIKITGEVGTGKTLLCRLLLNELQDGFLTAFVPNPQLNPNAFRTALAEELGLDVPRNAGQHRVLKHINECLIEQARLGVRVVLIVDEAQTMPDETLETVRLLTNLETEHEKLLQVVLFGQPELDARLRTERFRQLRQRIGFSYQLQPLDRQQTRNYLVHRLRQAGLSGEPCLSPAASDVLCDYARGVPRLVNMLAHKAFMAAYGEGVYRVEKRHVRRAAEDTEDVVAGRGWWRWLVGRHRPTALALLGGVALIGLALIADGMQGGLL